MTISKSLVLGAAIFLTMASCSHRRHSGSYSYSQPSYSSPAVTVQMPSNEPDDSPPTGKPFPTPQAAMDAVAAAAGLHDKAKVEEIFGVGATDVIFSGDDVADVEAGKRVKSMIEEGVTFEDRSPEETVAAVGKEKWPFPIPLVKTKEGWRFDLEAGKDELLTRRIGRNELETISTMYEYVEAQKEYFSAGRDGNKPAYAQKVRSSEGKHDGLFWATAEGEPESPFGDLITEARKAGYAPSEQQQPYHGYQYRILTGQGSRAPGGKKTYLEGTLMTRGFAAIAWPESYGNSGIMTFMVNQSGVVFEKDLGKETETLAAAMTEYDPDSSWRPTARKPLPDDE